MSKSQSLERGLDILEAVHRAGRAMGTRELARDLDLSPAIVQRMLNTLVDKHYLRRDPWTRRYVVGYQVLTFGAALAQRDALLLEGRIELEEVTRKLRLDSFMAVLQGQRAFYLICSASEGPVSVRCEPGQTIPLHSTAIGKCILSSFKDNEALDLLGDEPLPHITKKTITDRGKLLEDFALTRKRGYAVVEGENIEGITSVGALINVPEGLSPTAISLSFIPHITKDIDIDEAAAIIIAAAKRISKKISKDL